MYGRANSNGRAPLLFARPLLFAKYPEKFPDRRMLDYRIFQRLRRQLCETGYFHVSRYEAGWRRAVLSPSLDENILNFAANEESSDCT